MSPKGCLGIVIIINNTQENEENSFDILSKQTEHIKVKIRNRLIDRLVNVLSPHSTHSSSL